MRQCGNAWPEVVLACFPLSVYQSRDPVTSQETLGRHSFQETVQGRESRVEWSPLPCLSSFSKNIFLSSDLEVSLSLVLEDALTQR